MKKKNYVAIFLMNVEMILISLSLSGIFLLIAYISIRLLLYIVINVRLIDFLRLCLVFLFSAIVLFFIQPYIQGFFSMGRMGVFYNYFASGDVLLFFRKDASFQARVNVINTTFSSLMNHPFGNIAPYPIGGFMGFIYENGFYGVLFVIYYLFSFFSTLPYLRYEKKQVTCSFLTIYLIVPLLIFVDTLSVSYFIVLLNVLFYNSSKMVKNHESRSLKVTSF